MPWSKIDRLRGSDGAAGRDGTNGQAATIGVGTVSTGAAGSNAIVSNSGTPTAAVLNFTLPRGADGANGTNGTNGVNGQAATVSVGSTTTGAPGTTAAVTNSGTTSAAVLNFTIPRGDKGDQGQPGVISANPPLTLSNGVLSLGNASQAQSGALSNSDKAKLDALGRTLTQVYTGNVGETTLVSLSLGVRRFNVTVSGLTTSDRVLVVLGGAPSTGCELFNGYVSATNTVSVGVMVPTLGIGVTYSVPVVIYKIA